MTVFCDNASRLGSAALASQTAATIVRATTVLATAVQTSEPESSASDYAATPSANNYGSYAPTASFSAGGAENTQEGGASELVRNTGMILGAVAGVVAAIL